MHKIIKFLKNKYTVLALVAVAVFGYGLLRGPMYAKSDNCPQLAPTSPIFNNWPLSYNTTQTCVGLSMMEVKDLNGSGRDARYSQSQSEHDAGINANPGDTLNASIYFHNGASDQVDRSLTTAHNVQISSSVDAGASTAHRFSASISASNASTVRSSDSNQGGDFIVHTASNTTLSYIPGSAGICISPQAASELGRNDGTCGASGQNIFVKMPDGIFNGSVSLGDLKACFPYAGTLVFKVAVNGASSSGGSAQLSVVKQVQDFTTNSAFGSSVNATTGDSVQYKVSVTNTGSAAAQNVVASDPGVSGINTAVTSNNLGNIAAGQTVTFMYSGTVNASSGTLVNTVTVSADNASVVSASATVFVNSGNTGGGNANLQITKGVRDNTQGQSSYVASTNAFNGDQVQFQVTVTNNGGVTANNVIINDNNPFGLNIIPGSVNTNVGNFTSPTNIFVGSIAPGQSVFVNFLANVNTAFGTLTNTASTQASNASTVSASATVNVINSPNCTGNLLVNKMVRNLSQGNSFFSKSVTANINDRIAYQITITAQSCSANNITVFESLPSGFNYAFGSARLNGNSFTDSFVNSNTNIGSLSQGSQDVIYFEGNVNSNFGFNCQSVLTNTVNVSADNVGISTDSASVFMNNNNCHGSTSFSQLNINKQVRDDNSNLNFWGKSINASINDRVTFSITVVNTGNLTVNNVNVNDFIPGGLNYIGGSTRLDGNFANDFINSNGQINLGSMSAGQQHNIMFDATVSGAQGQTIQNTASASADNASTVQDTASVFVNSQNTGSNINLQLSKRAVNNTQNTDATVVPANREDFITYTLTVYNSGNVAATNYVIQDDLSSVLNYATLADNGGGSMNGNVISWPALTIPAGGSVNESFKVRVNFFLPNAGNLNLINTFGNTVTIRINNGSRAPVPFVAPKTGASENVAFGFAGIMTAVFAVVRRKKILESAYRIMPKLKIKF